MSLSYFEGKNSGTFKQLHIIKQSAATFPYPPALQEDLAYADDITTTENWLTLVGLPNSGRWEETGGLDQDGNEIYSYNMELVVNKDRQTITKMLRDKIPYNLLTIIEDQNAGIRLVGSDEHHCTISYSQVKERGIIQPNLYTIRITCEMTHPAVYYSGSFTGS